MRETEGFLLLSIPQVLLSMNGSQYNDTLYLECVTIPELNSQYPDRDVYLVFRISDLEMAIDPSRRFSSSERLDSRTYFFHGTDREPAFEIIVPSPHGTSESQDLETFDQILSQYAQFYSEQTDDKSAIGDVPSKAYTRERSPSPAGGDNEYQDLRGRLVLVNESDGHVVGELDNKFTIREDPALTHGLSEHDPVFLDLPPDYDSATRTSRGAPSTTIEAFVHAVPPGERDILTDTASLISHNISATIMLLLSGVNYATDYYIRHSEPSSKYSSPATSSSSLATTDKVSRSQPPVHGAVIVTNSNVGTALTYAHAISGMAVKISGKTVEAVDGLIKRALGAENSNSKPKSLHPPAHLPAQADGVSPSFTNVRPPLPPRKGDGQYATQSNPYKEREEGPPLLPPRPPLRKRDRVMLSADLILSTIEESARQVLDAGQAEITKVVTHKFGQKAGENTALTTGTVRNVALVYIDLHGIGRRAILGRTAREFVKARARSSRGPAI